MKYERNRKGSIILPSGETITKKEQQAFRSAVASANQYRQKEIARLEGTGKQIYRDFGKTNDVLLQKKSASFANFTNKAQFKNALERARTTVPSVNERARIYKQNTIKAIETNYGDTPLTRKLKYEIIKMKSKDFVRKVDSGKLDGVEFVYYDPNNDKLKHLANGLGVDIGDLPQPIAKNRR